jgi:hypothetical protein
MLTSRTGGVRHGWEHGEAALAVEKGDRLPCKHDRVIAPANCGWVGVREPAAAIDLGACEHRGIAIPVSAVHGPSLLLRPYHQGLGTATVAGCEQLGATASPSSTSWVMHRGQTPVKRLIEIHRLTCRPHPPRCDGGLSPEVGPSFSIANSTNAAR